MVSEHGFKLSEDKIWLYDNDNNRVSVKAFGLEIANFKLLMLQGKRNKNCTNCWDVTNCSNCIECGNCKNCHDCKDCHYCNSCNKCVLCHTCSNCGKCDSCKGCSACHDCMKCDYCKECHDCEFSTNLWKKASEQRVHRRFQWPW